jgi:hypothetical protein
MPLDKYTETKSGKPININMDADDTKNISNKPCKDIADPNVNNRYIVS